MSNSNKPVHEVRLGSNKAAIRENETSTGIRHNVTLQRIYRDGEQWKTGDSFGRDDLPLVIKVSDLAHSWIYQHPQSSNGQERKSRSRSPC